MAQLGHLGRMTRKQQVVAFPDLTHNNPGLDRSAFCLHLNKGNRRRSHQRPESELAAFQSFDSMAFFRHGAERPLALALVPKYH